MKNKKNIQQAMLELKLSRFQRRVRNFPEIKIPEKIRRAAENKGYVFN